MGLAQALLGFPKVLILDEPTVGLDPKQILEMPYLIRQLAQEHTVILSSHILSEVQEVCDHLLIIHHGKKVAAGEPAELERSLSGNPALEIVVRGEGEAVQSQLALLSGITSLTQHDCPEQTAAPFAWRARRTRTCGRRYSRPAPVRGCPCWSCAGIP